MKLEKKKKLLIGFMLFSLFFGAGNLIFPPFLGQNAGQQTIPAMIGFLMTAVILPVLGVVVVARFDGMDRLAQNVSEKFSRSLRCSFICPLAQAWAFLVLPLFLSKWLSPLICLKVPTCPCGWWAIRWCSS